MPAPEHSKLEIIWENYSTTSFSEKYTCDVIDAGWEEKSLMLLLQFYFL